MTLDGARPDAHEVGRVLDGPACGDVGRENVNLTVSPRLWEGAPEVTVSHAKRLTAAIHSSRPSMGI